MTADIERAEADAVEAAAEVARRLVANVEEVVVGKTAVLQLVLAAFAARGHVLLEDVPGTTKTMLARALAASVEDAEAVRIQCTPDLQPTDVTGLSVWDPPSRRFEFRRGPVFATPARRRDQPHSPKAQSALLEAMAEGQVTVDDVTRPLPDSFFVIATENPIDTSVRSRSPSHSSIASSSARRSGIPSSTRSCGS